jgi:hypothetical protein
MAPPVHICD